MFILPLIRIPEKSPGLHQFWFFLERNGTHLIECEQTSPEDAIQHAKEFAGLNDLALDGEPYCAGDLVLCPIKKDSPELNNFYTWKETPAGTTPPREVWRSFLWTSSEDNVDPWGVNRLLDSIRLSDSHTAFSVLSAVNGP
jgi:hypothetical protein